MIDCENIQKSFIPFIEGTLDANKTSRVEAHLSTCDECAGFFSVLEESFQAIEEEKFVDIEPSFLKSIEDKIDTKSTNRTSIMISRWLSYAAVIALSLFAGNAIVSVLSLSTQQPQQSDLIKEFLWDDLEQEPIESFLLTNEDLF